MRHRFGGPLVRPVRPKQSGRGSLGGQMPFVGTLELTSKLTSLYLKFASRYCKYAPALTGNHLIRSGIEAQA